jgi:O-antigen/teichoic acid export membrane protein
MALIRSTLAYAVANVVSSGIPFLILPVLTRVLSPQDYGTLTVFSLAVTYFGAMTGLSVHGAVTIRYFEQDRYDLAKYVGACFLILMTSTAVVVGVTALALHWLDADLGIPHGWILVAAAVSGAQFVTQIRLALWQSSGKVWQFGAVRVAQAAVDASTSLILVLMLGFAWQGRALGMTTAAVAAAMFAIWTLAAERGIRFSGSAVYVGDAVRFGAPLVFHTLGGLLITTGDKLVVGSLVSLNDLGQYAVAGQVVSILNVLYDAIFKAFQPWVIQRSLMADQRRQVVQTIYKVLIGTTLLGIGFLFAAMLFYPLLVGERYRSGLQLVPVLVAAAVIRCGYFATAIFINIASKNEHLALNSMLSGIAGLASAALLVPYIGLVGAAYGVVIAELISFILNMRSSNRVFPMPWLRA